MLLHSEQEVKKLLNLSVKMARLMLRYGAEVYRVEDTIHRICTSFTNLKAVNVLITYNFVIVTFVYDDTNYTTMRRVIIGEKNLEKISLINDLSRKIVMGGCTLDYAFTKLKAIKETKPYSDLSVVLALVLSAPFFAVMFGGTFKDTIYAFIVMAIEALFVVYATRYKIMYFLSNFMGAFIATVITTFAAQYLPIHNPSSLIIVALMPLVPGVQITNSVRDFMAGDYISGMIGVQSAIFVSTAIALGVVFGLRVF